MIKGVQPPKLSPPKQPRSAGAKGLSPTTIWCGGHTVRLKPALDGSGARRAGEAMRRQRLRESAAARPSEAGLSTIVSSLMHAILPLLQRALFGVGALGR